MVNRSGSGREPAQIFARGGRAALLGEEVIRLTPDATIVAGVSPLSFSCAVGVLRSWERSGSGREPAQIFARGGRAALLGEEVIRLTPDDTIVVAGVSPL
jgi:hypothetical protein